MIFHSHRQAYSIIYATARQINSNIESLRKLVRRLRKDDKIMRK
ncbi:conserved hypothetical protein [Xenorhabdus bovienii SS-2004]|uniref:Uncharacterized protein n=1 Tax=Xenorhabdus bovienii (strain SS-2004) TaxID=406818 RepID=D3UWW8_XENBS|nr:conserved hypothetical protein [Xenorhabdus bovienii SS-2004]